MRLAPLPALPFLLNRLIESPQDLLVALLNASLGIGVAALPLMPSADMHIAARFLLDLTVRSFATA